MTSEQFEKAVERQRPQLMRYAERWFTDLGKDNVEDLVSQTVESRLKEYPRFDFDPAKGGEWVWFRTQLESRYKNFCRDKDIEREVIVPDVSSHVQGDDGILKERDQHFDHNEVAGYGRGRFGGKKGGKRNLAEERIHKRIDSNAAKDRLSGDGRMVATVTRT